MTAAPAKKLFYPTPKWKYLVGTGSALLCLYLVGWTFAGLIRPDTAPRPPLHSPEEVAATLADRQMPDKLDPAALPRVSLEIAPEARKQSAEFFARQPAAERTQIEVEISAGRLPKWYPRGESPLLAELRKTDNLPPVAERVGPEPVVMRGCEGLGGYGGTWLRIANSPDDVSVIGWRLSFSALARFSPLGEPVVAHVAKSFEPQNGGREWLVTLRQIRWSDGEPVTTADLAYGWYNETLDPNLGGGRLSKLLYVGGEPAKLEVLDEHRVKFIFAHPYLVFPQVLTRLGLTPEHYFKKFHPTLGDQELIKREMTAYGLPTPRALYAFLGEWKNPDCPRLWPWIYRKYTTGSPQVFVRNPYYYAVDEQGNQLPYLDRVMFEVMDDKMLTIAAAGGRVTMQNRFIRFESYTDIMSRRNESHTRLLHWVPGTRSEWLIYPNLNRCTPPGQPEAKYKAELLADARFRQALSLALNRQRVSDALYFGLTRPVQVDPGPLSPYQAPELAQAFVRHDPKQAAQLLDEVWRAHGAEPNARAEGYRCLPDGKPLTFYLDFCEFTGQGPAQFVVDDWAQVGIRCIYRQRARNLFYTEKAWRNFDFNVWSSESETLPFLSARCFIAEDGESNFAIGWGLWYSLGGLYGHPAAQRNGTLAPPADSPMRRAMEAYEAARMAPDAAVAKEHFARIMAIAAENLWTINLCEAPPALAVCNADLHNVPDKAMVGACLNTPGNTGIETYYFAHPDRAGEADALDQLRHPTHRPYEVAVGGGSPLRYLFIGVLILLVGLAALRHPFILRRLAIMVPTLLVVSICVFAIIQLPPGDYLSSRIMQLQETGSPPELVEQEIRTLRALFHFDEPAAKRYLRWLGVYWFAGFQPEDAGLLQGNMGRSMATGGSVNSLVGDRITLTFLISLGTVLFTWALAIPIGIYSACRQYSAGDYAFTFMGFLGMCVPPFLLALVLMAVTNISGLFSPQYAIQPEWSWGKVADLLGHVWIPILVMGVSGTAGMIRVMRANLLDELRKPYVTTARAKGLRPLKLLVKYPVRLALNPFISGIGGLFPALVSGSSIVAIVMSLPTVGPLMLAALFSQDMNLAGSMLMVLSLLGVFGTLVSDLLLLWLDPRIRLGGAEK